jgi:hypothetical protein
MTAIVRGLARRSKSNNFYKTIFFIYYFHILIHFISLYELTFANAKAFLLLRKTRHFLMRNGIGRLEKEGSRRERPGSHRRRKA